jgi:hypothetical protein
LLKLSISLVPGCILRWKFQNGGARGWLAVARSSRHLFLLLCVSLAFAAPLPALDFLLSRLLIDSKPAFGARM